MFSKLYLQDYFVLITNKNSDGFKIVKLLDKDIEKGIKSSIDFIVPKENQIIEEFDALHDFVAVYLKTQGIAEVLIHDLNDGKKKTIRIDGDVGEISPGINQNYHSKTLRFTHTSPIVSIFEKL